MPEPTIQEVHQALGELRSTLESKNFDMLDALDKEKVDKINDFLDKDEKRNQEVTTALAAAEKESVEQKERIDTLEKLVAHQSTQEPKSYRETESYKALQSFCKFGDEKISSEEKALLRTDINTDGGYRTGEEIDPEIIKNVSEFSPIRNFARVRSVSEKQLRMIVRKTLLTAQFEGEAEEGPEDASTYGQELLNTFRQTVTVPVTLDQLMNDNFDMMSDILTDANEAFAVGESNGFFNGVGNKGPHGLLQESRLTGITSGTVAAIDADDYILVQAELKGPYNGTFAFNRKTLANLRTKKSTDGVYLFAPGLNGPAANTVAGSTYFIAQDMPDIGTGNKSVLYGDLFRAYTIVDRAGVSVIRDDYTRKKEAIVEFTIHRWLNGKTVLPEAMKTITVQ